MEQWIEKLLSQYKKNITINEKNDFYRRLHPVGTSREFLKKYADRPWLNLLAGPSLDSIIPSKTEVINRAQRDGKIYVMGVEVCHGALQENGINPDVTWNMDTFEGCDWRSLIGKDTSKGFFSIVSCNPSMLSEWKGKTWLGALISYDSDPHNEWAYDEKGKASNRIFNKYLSWGAVTPVAHITALMAIQMFSCKLKATDPGQLGLWIGMDYSYVNGKKYCLDVEKRVRMMQPDFQPQPENITIEKTTGKDKTSVQGNKNLLNIGKLLLERVYDKMPLLYGSRGGYLDYIKQPNVHYVDLEEFLSEIKEA